MGKKNETAKPVTAIAEIPALKKTTNPVAEAAGSIVAPAKPPAANGNGGSGGDRAPAKAAVKKAVKKKPAKKPVTFSSEDIALRAYFIAEKRQRHGIHGDEHSDWIQAERQLRAEQRKKTTKKPAGTKKRA